MSQKKILLIYSELSGSGIQGSVTKRVKLPYVNMEKLEKKEAKRLIIDNCLFELRPISL